MAKKKIEAMNLEELEQEAARLLEEKRAIKAQERAVEDQRMFLVVTAGMPERLAKRVKLEGAVAPEGSKA